MNKIQRSMAVVSSIDSYANGMFFGLQIINKAKKWSGHGLTSLTGSSAPDSTRMFLSGFPKSLVGIYMYF